MRRKLLVLALGVTFLIVMTWIATIMTSYVPRHPTAQTQTAQAGPYQITLQVEPNPPLITQPATLSLQVLRSDTQQPITNARVTLESDMETMDMGTDQTSTQVQSSGVYLAHVQFSMSGPWQVRVLVAVPGTQTQSTVFEVVAQ
ncbi:MAG: FixH family protein [Chloroflexi bacterium]|nr:FixH family protein [Chloroflexota bacterium]